jgi:hypothetical protein
MKGVTSRTCLYDLGRQLIVRYRFSASSSRHLSAISLGTFDSPDIFIGIYHCLDTTYILGSVTTKYLGQPSRRWPALVNILS